MDKLSEWLTHAVDVAPSWLVPLVVFVVLFSETAILVCGLIMPSEAVLIAAGVAASLGRTNIFALIVIACVAAFAGDLTGYTVGRRSGERITRSWAGRKFGEERWEHAEDRVRRNSWVTVPVGRWIGYVRTLVPIAAGIAHVNPVRYAVATAIGGISWATTVLLLSFILGATAGVRLVGLLVVVLVVGGVLAVMVRWMLARRRGETEL